MTCAASFGLPAAHRFPVFVRNVDHRRELRIPLFAKADVAGIDPVFRQRFGTGRVIVEQLVADIMEIADDRHIKAHQHQPVTDIGHGLGRLIAVNRHAHDLGACGGKGGNLCYR
jgi:hypothetical protein